MHAGEIVLQEKIKLDALDNYGLLSAKLAETAA